jgi:hypothetical protein
MSAAIAAVAIAEVASAVNANAMMLRIIVPPSHYDPDSDART